MKSFLATLFALMLAATIAQEPTANNGVLTNAAEEASTSLQDEGTDEIDLEEDDSAIAAKRPQIKGRRSSVRAVSASKSGTTSTE